jgi:hypothetical protein
MKTAIYIEDGLLQLVLTPQSETDRKVLTTLEEAGTNLKTHRGEFYACQGGWTRQKETYDSGMGYTVPHSPDDSLIFVVVDKSKT